MVALTDTEQREIAEQFREELQETHDQRIERVNRQKTRSKKSTSTRNVRAREAEMARIQEEVRTNFYKEKGYLQYTDSTGRKSWLPPEEHAWRMKRRGNRKRRRKNVIEFEGLSRWMIATFYGGMFVVAILLGVLLTR